jgi:hypothetical protein
MNDMDAKARALFERSVQQLDEASVRRLRLARRAALAGRAPVPHWRAWPAGLAAAAVLALGLVWWLPRDPPAPQPAQHVAASAAVRAPADEPVLAEADEDADLYAWLGEAPVATDDAEQRL